MKRLVLVTLALMLAAGVLASCQPPLPPEEAGVTSHIMWGDQTDLQRIVILDKLKAANTDWIRLELGWHWLEQAGPGVYTQWYLERLEFVVTAIRSRGIKVLAVLSGTPAWANGGCGDFCPPDDPDDYASIAGWLAARFQGRIAAWEIWNEPNVGSRWVGVDAVRYTRLLQKAYPAIKTADPAAVVLDGGTPFNNTNWLRQLYDAGARGYFDAHATHPYLEPRDAPPEVPDTGTKTMRHVKAVHDLMVARGDTNKPIWFTEFGWSSHTNTGLNTCELPGVSVLTQADYLTRALQMIARNYPYVKVAFWTSDRDLTVTPPPFDPCGEIVHQNNYGLLRSDLSEKPAFSALKTWATAAAAAR